MKSFKIKGLFLLLIIFISCNSSNSTKTVKSLEKKKTLENITFFHFNDFHADITPFVNKDNKKVSGAAYFGSYLNNLRRENKNSILVYSGDIFMTTPFDKINKGKTFVKIFNMFSPDVATIGNHELDYGKKKLIEYLKEFKYPVISANLFNNDNKPLTKQYKIIKKDGLNILFIGLFPTNGKWFYEDKFNIRIKNPYSVIKKIIKSIKQDIDFTVLVSHLGYDVDYTLAEKLENHKELGVDLIIGGHSHTIVNKIDKSLSIPIIQAGANGEYIGKLNVTINTSTNSLDKINNYNLLSTYIDNVKQNKKIENLIDKDKSQIKDLFKTIATTNVILSNESRITETQLGNLIVDSLQNKYKTDFAVYESKGIRRSASGKKITANDIYEALPFTNALYKVLMRGRDIKKMLNYYLSKNDRILLVSYNLKYKYKTYGRRKKVSQIMYKNKKIDMNKDYELIVGERFSKKCEKYYNAEIQKKVANNAADAIINHLKKIKVYKAEPLKRRFKEK